MPHYINGRTMLTIQDVAEHRGVTYQSVVFERHKGMLPKEDMKIGRSPLWAEDTITEWLANRPGLDWAARPDRAEEASARARGRERGEHGRFVTTTS